MYIQPRSGEYLLKLRFWFDSFDWLDAPKVRRLT